MAIAAVFWKQRKVATMMINKYHNMRFLGLLVVLVLTQGCAQRLGTIIPQGGERIWSDTPLKNRVYGATTLMATENYLFATGSGSGLAIVDFNSGLMNANLSGIAGSALVPFVLTNDTANVLSMVEAGGNLYISSQPGLYRINIANITYPQLTLALPYSFPNSFATYSAYSTIPNFQDATKEQFRFDSMVYVPNQNQIWGFRGNRMSRLNLNNLNAPQVQTLSINTSCGQGDKQSSAYFQGKVYVAACSQVLVLDPNSGSFSGNFPYRINAVQVVATRNRLYVHHQPVQSWGQYSNSAQPGVYVFDSNLRHINYIGIEPISFAVSPDDELIYANEDDSEIISYQIP